MAGVDDVDDSPASVTDISSDDGDTVVYDLSSPAAAADVALHSSEGTAQVRRTPHCRVRTHVRPRIRGDSKKYPVHSSNQCD